MDNKGHAAYASAYYFYYGPGLVGKWAQSLESANFFVRWLCTWHVFDRFFAVMLAFVINYACYFSEIFRGGIEGIPRGQYEAGQVWDLHVFRCFQNRAYAGCKAHCAAYEQRNNHSC